MNWNTIETCPKDESVLLAYEYPFFGEMAKGWAKGYFDTERNTFYIWSLREEKEIELDLVTHWSPAPELPPVCKTQKEWLAEKMAKVRL